MQASLDIANALLGKFATIEAYGCVFAFFGNTNVESKFHHINSTTVLDFQTARLKNRYALPTSLKTDLHT